MSADAVPLTVVWVFCFCGGFVCFFTKKSQPNKQHQKSPPHTEAKPDGQMLLLLMLLIPLQDYLLNETAGTSTFIACHRYQFSPQVCLYQI